MSQKERTAQKKQKKGIGRMSVVLTVLIILMAIMNIPCLIEQYEKNYEAKSLQKTLEVEQNKGERLKIEYEIKTDYKAIEDYVSANMQMKKAEPYQVEYILKNNDDKSKVVKAEDDSEGFFAKITKSFSMIAEYFQ